MKTLILLTLTLSFYLTSTAQNRCYCELTYGYNYPEGQPKLYSGEERVSLETDMWVQMNPSAARNKCDQGGCWLRAGSKITMKNGKPARVYDCGNDIVSWSFSGSSSGSFGATTRHSSSNSSAQPAIGGTLSFEDGMYAYERVSESALKVQKAQNDEYIRVKKEEADIRMEEKQFDLLVELATKNNCGDCYSNQPQQGYSPVYTGQQGQPATYWNNNYIQQQAPVQQYTRRGRPKSSVADILTATATTGNLVLGVANTIRHRNTSRGLSVGGGATPYVPNTQAGVNSVTNTGAVNTGQGYTYQLY